MHRFKEIYQSESCPEWMEARRYAIKYLKQSFPGFCPKTIFDFGPGGGISTALLRENYPSASILAADPGLIEQKNLLSNARLVGYEVKTESGLALMNHPEYLGSMDLIAAFYLGPIWQKEIKLFENLLFAARKCLRRDGVVLVQSDEKTIRFCLPFLVANSLPIEIFYNRRTRSGAMVIRKKQLEQFTDL